MGFSKINYGSGEEIFETTVQDGSGRILDKWKCNKKDFFKVARILNKKYGLNLIIKERKDQDLDWAKDF